MANGPINKPIRGIRDSIPGGYVLGRPGAGNGPPILLPIGNFASKGFVAQTTIQQGGAAGGDLGGTYPDPTVTGIQGHPVSSGAPSTHEVLEWTGSAYAPTLLATVAYSNSYLDLTNLPPLTGGTTGQVLTKTSGTDYAFDWQTASGGVLIGSGVPTALETAGTLYSRNDAAGVYASEPITMSLAPTPVQSGFKDNSFTAPTVVLGSAPSVGNLVIAFVAYGGSAAWHNGWTQFAPASAPAGSNALFGIYRYVQAGDTATLPTFNADAGGIVRATAMEITSVSGTWATDFDTYVTASNTPVGPLTTGAPSELLLLASGFGSGFGSYTASAGWTNDQDDGSGSTTLDNFTEATMGTGVSASPTWSAGGESGHWIMMGLKGGSTTTANWDLIGPEPLASSTVFGVAKVDGTSILSTAGILSSQTPKILLATATEVDGPNTATASDGVMVGAGSTYTFTPNITGKIKISGTFVFFITNVLASARARLRYGTGTPPVNGASATGTIIVTNPFKATVSINGEQESIAFTFIVSGLTLGTTYWLDYSTWSDNSGGGGAGTIQVQTNYMVIEEVT